MQMIRAKCTPCGWIFDLVSAPMNLTLWAETAKDRARCPMCGTRTGIVMAESRPLTDAERAHKIDLIPASIRETA